MGDQFLLILSFITGVIIQLSLLALNRNNWLFFIFIILCSSLVAMIPLSNEGPINVYAHFLFACILSSFSVTYCFYRDLLPTLSALSLFSVSSIFLFSFFSFFRDHSFAHFWLLTAILLIPTVLTVMTSFYNGTFNFFWKVFVYIWFLVMVVFLGLILFPFDYLRVFSTEGNNLWFSFFSCTLAGMAFSYLAVNASYLFLLIPFPWFRKSMNDWYRLADLVAQRFYVTKAKRNKAGIIIFFQGGFLVLNYLYNFLSVHLTINIIITINMVLSNLSRWERGNSLEFMYDTDED